MFGSTQKVKLTLDADGKATGIASSETQGAVAGAISHVLSHLSEDEVVIGTGRTVGAGLMIAAPMYFVNYKLTGQFNLNPLSAG